MFNEITIKPSKDLLFDLGRIAESLLFYKKVNLVCGPPFFKKLVETDETDSFLELMKSGKIQVHIEDNIFASMRKEINNQTILWYKPVLVQGKDISIQDRLQRVIFESTQRSGYSRRLSKKIIDRSQILLHSDGILDFVKDDLKDSVYIKRAISHTLKNLNPDIIINPEEINISVEEIKEGYVINTNLNLDKINENALLENLFSYDSILLNITNTRVDSVLSGNMNSDLSTNPIITTLLKEKVNNVITQSTKNKEQIDNFSDVYVSDGKKIRDVLNSGERSLYEFIKILEKADKFKDWLENIENDKNLLSEYNKAVTSETWVDKLPGKSLRWSIFTGIGFGIDLLGAGGLGTAIGTAISAGDTFLLDKLVDGWKPNIFVDNELKEFIDKP